MRVRSSDQRALARLLRAPDVTVSSPTTARCRSPALPAAQIGAIAAAAGITVLELATEQASLEDAFVDLTKDAVEYRAALLQRRGVIMTTTTHHLLPPRALPSSRSRSESPRPG